jgi:hypothetical protein
MKKLLSLVLLVVASSALADDWPTRPFTFIGIPEKIRIESHQSVHGKMQNMVHPCDRSEGGLLRQAGDRI